MEKKYWQNLEELQEKAISSAEEFSPPSDQETSGVDRREFLKFMGAGLLLSTMACSRRPVEKIIPYVNKPEEVMPGVANWYTSTCAGCAAGCGLLVKTREGRPIKLEGNPNHPVNQGGLCARGQASILGLYEPTRIKNPQVVSRKDGSIQEVHWEQVDEGLRFRLEEIAKEGKGVYILSGP